MKPKVTMGRFLLSMLVLLLSAHVAWADGEKITPSIVIDLSEDFEKVPVGQANFTKPGVSLKIYDEDGITVKEDVTSLYNIIYYIGDGETFTRDENNRDISTDATTGTTVSKTIGTVVVGHKNGGAVTVNVKATPKAAFADSYNEVTSSYTFTVQKIAPEVSLPSEMTIHFFSKLTSTEEHKTDYGEEATEENRLYKYEAKSEQVQLPAKNIYVTTSTGYKQDLSKIYNVAYSFSRPAGSSATMVKEKDGNMVLDMEEYADYNPLNDIKSEIEKKYAKEGDITLTVTYTVADKDTYGGYEDKSQDVTIHVVGNNFETLTATLSFAEDHSAKETAIVFSRWNDKDETGRVANALHQLPVPTVTNAQGVDITDKTVIKYEIVEEYSELDDCQHNHMNPGGEIWEEGKSLEGSFNPNIYNVIGSADSKPYYQSYKPGYVKIRAYAVTRPTDGIYNEYSKLAGEIKDPESGEVTDKFDLGSDEYRISEPQSFWVYIKKRVPTIAFNPDPSKITVSTSDHINMNNRFDIKGYATDADDGTAGTLTYGAQWGEGEDTFWYTFEFTSETGIEVLDWPHSDRVELYTSDGTKLVPSMEWGLVDAAGNYGMKEVYREADNWDKIHEKKDIVRYVYWAVKGFNTDDLWSVHFTKSGTYDIKYKIYPFNHARWDVGEEFVKTYTVVNAIEPTLNIDPDHLSALVNQKDFVEPEVWVADPEGNEITQDFKFKYTIVSGSETGTTVSSPTGYTPYGKPDHEISIGGSVGDVTVKVEATTTFEENENAAKYSKTTLEGTYTIHIFKNDMSEPLYEIINSKDVKEFTGPYADYKAAADPVMGKMHFINTGSLYTGYSIDGVPGLIIRFGKYDGSVWTVSEDTSGDVTGADNSKDNESAGKRFAYDETPVVLDENGIATAGAFLEFTSATNGYLRVDARWEKGQSYTLIDFDYPDQNEVFTPTETVKGDHQFEKALLTDHSYQLYCSTEGQLNLHGIAFDPAFIKTREGGVVKNGSSFLIGVQNVPELALSNTANVTYEVDPETNKNNKGEECAVIENASVHKVTAKHFTILDKSAETMFDDSESTDVIIYGKVMSSIAPGDYTSTGHKAENGVPYKYPAYMLTIADIPTYRLGDGLDTSGQEKDKSDFTPAPGVEVTTYNIPTKITMTYGGWKNSYMAKASDTEATTDAYEAKTDNEVGGYTSTDKQFSRYIDGFSWSNVAKTNPLNENNTGDYKAYRWTVADAETDDADPSKHYHNTFDLPAKGAYWKFEPEENGVIFIYLVQNGISTYSGNAQDLVNTTKTPHGLDWKPLYIVDESGRPAEMLNASSMEAISEFVANGDKKEDESDAYTDGLVRADIADPNIIRFISMIGDFEEGKAPTEDAYNAKYEEIMSQLAKAATEYAGGNYDQAKLDSCVYLWTYKNSKGKDAGFEVDYQEEGDKLQAMKLRVLQHWSKPGERQVIFQDPNGPGYAMVSKAYVRYAINAKAGKTYWVFQQGSKPNLCGFGFVPEWFPNKTVTTETISLDDNTSLEESLSGKDLTKAANVTYTRTFKNNTWTSLCLPFSVSQRNFKKVFGENATIVTYEGVSEGGRKANFTQHNYHMMEAGRGYFIKPAWDDDVESVGSITFEGVTIETTVDDSHTFTTATLKDMPALNKFIMYDQLEHKTAGNKKKALRMVGTYDGEDMPAYSYFINGMLYRNTSVLHCGRYRAYLKNPNEDPDEAKMFAMFSETEFEEPYEDTEDQQPVVTTVKGVFNYTGNDMTDLRLADGVYNVAGQKVAKKGTDISKLNKGVYVIDGKKVVIK